MYTTETIDEQLGRSQARREELQAKCAQVAAELATKKQLLARAVADKAPSRTTDLLRQTVRELQAQREEAIGAIGFLESDAVQLTEQRKGAALEEAQARYAELDEQAVLAIQRVHAALVPWIRDVFLPLADAANAAQRSADIASDAVRLAHPHRERPLEERRFGEGWNCYPDLAGTMHALRSYQLGWTDSPHSEIESVEADLDATYEWGGYDYGPGARILIPQGLADQLRHPVAAR